MEGASEDKGELARLVSKATMRTFQKKDDSIDQYGG